MHSNSIGCPKTFPPVCSSFVLVIASDMHLEPESERRAKNVDFHTAKNIQNQTRPFRYFRTNPYKLTSDLFTVVRLLLRSRAERGSLPSRDGQTGTRYSALSPQNFAAVNGL